MQHFRAVVTITFQLFNFQRALIKCPIPQGIGIRERKEEGKPNLFLPLVGNISFFLIKPYSLKSLGCFIDKEFRPPPPLKCAENRVEIAYITTFYIDGWVCGGPLGHVSGVPGPPFR